MFVTFEGIDLAGKSTQAELLEQYLKNKGFDVVILREPGGTEVSEKIREILLNPKFTFNSFTELFLFEASRADLVRKVIKPKLEQGCIVICDRFWDSTIAYQGYGRKIPLNFIEICNLYASDGLEPNLTFLLDIPLDVVLERLKNKSTDRMENEDRDFLIRVINGFRELSNRYPNRIQVVDGTGRIEDIHQRIIEIINNFMGKK
ncbi:MAG: dTMP kinase [Candidatus Kapaibacteriota bacterium]